MLYPSRIAWCAASTITGGGGVSQTPCARLIPPIRSHSVVMARISDWSVSGASALSDSREGAAIPKPCASLFLFDISEALSHQSYSSSPPHLNYGSSKSDDKTIPPESSRGKIIRL